MTEFIKLVTELINNIHDMLILLSNRLDLQLTDKDLHFWIIGIIGILLFFLTDLLCRWLASWNVSIISFIYTFTVLVVLVFSLEIEQKITKRGHMEFNDIVAGLWGFLVAFGIYLGFRIIFYFIMKSFKKNSRLSKRRYIKN